MKTRRILIVEDDAALAKLVKRSLEGQRGVKVEVTGSGFGALRTALDRVPDLVVLDVGLPDVDGFEVCRVLRARRRTAHVPLIMISGRTSEADRIRGLDLGADDYLTKPFSLAELEARVRAILRRRQPPSEPRLAVFDSMHLKANFKDVIVEVDGTLIELTRRELDLLRYLLEHRRRILSQERLLRDVWGGAHVRNETRTVAVHIARLRAKLGAVGHQIETVVGVGYRFNDRG